MHCKFLVLKMIYDETSHMSWVLAGLIFQEGPQQHIKTVQETMNKQQILMRLM